MKRVAGLYIAWLIAAGMLVYAVIENHPYSYYILLRWICCAVFAYSAVSAFQTNRLGWTWIFGALAALYNPIFRVHLDRPTWIGINWATIAVIVVAAVTFWRPKRRGRSVTTDSTTQKADTKQNRAVKLGDFCRFRPRMTSLTSLTMWRMWEKGLIDLAAGDIVKVIASAAGEALKDRTCYVNKPGKCPVIATMELVETEWLEPINAKFKECEYCAAIDHATSDCPYRGKVPYGWKGTGPWRIEGGKMFFDEGKSDGTKSHFPQAGE